MSKEITNCTQGCCCCNEEHDQVAREVSKETEAGEARRVDSFADRYESSLN